MFSHKVVQQKETKEEAYLVINKGRGGGDTAGKSPSLAKGTPPETERRT